MTNSHLAKTSRLDIAIQLTEIPGGSFEGRVWEVHDVERNRGFRVQLLHSTMEEDAGGRPRADQRWSETEIERAVGLAVERVLTSGGDKVAGVLYEVEVTCQDLHASRAVIPTAASRASA